MSDLQEIYKHPLVQELITQNQMMADQLPEAGLQHLSLSKKINLEDIKVPHLIKDRVLFQEGLHNGLFYPGEELKKNIELWDNNDLMFAEHADASNVWVGLTKNPRYSEEERAIRGDLELADKNAAQKLEYQILNKNGRMGISPTIDVDKKLVGGRMCAMGPYTLKSQSVVLDPAVKTTMFNSANGGAANMEPNNLETQNLKKDEVALKKEDLEKYKAAEKELADYKQKELSHEVEELAKLEVEIGRTAEESLSERKQILEKLSTEERKVLKDSYDWVIKELSDKSDEERFVDNLTEDLKGKIPPGLREFIEEKKKKKKDEEMAKLTPEEKKKKEEEEKKNKLADKDDKKKYPYPEQKLNESTEELSQTTEKLISKNNINRFQELSEQNKESNQEFIDFLLVNQGDNPQRGAK